MPASFARVRVHGMCSRDSVCQKRVEYLMTWILPNRLRTSAYAQDMEVLTWGSPESFEVCARSLIRRSKSSPQASFARAWKRGSLMLPQYGAILGRSHSDLFVERWVSSLADFRVNPSAPRASAPETKIRDTSSPTSSEGSQSASPISSSSKTLRESSVPSSRETDGETPQGRPFCSMSLENWKEWVTAQRQEYSVRLKSGRATSANESSSSQWPTPDVAQAQKVSNRPNHGQLGLANHPEVHGYHCTRPPLHKDRKGLAKAPQGYADHCRPVQTSGGGSQIAPSILAPELPTDTDDSLIKSAMPQWPTPNTINRTSQKAKTGRVTAGPSRGGPSIGLEEAAEMWPTPNVPNGGRQPAPGISVTGQTLDGKKRQVELAHAINMWPTPRANSSTGAGQGPNQTGAPNLQTKVNGKLNPRWVETLMGLPVGWTIPSCAEPWTVALTNSDSSETALIPMSLREPSERCMAA